LECIEQKLQIKAGETTADSKFSLETVNCLGCCALGPVIEIDGQYFGKLNSGKIDKLLTNY
jgi:NADH-quinone oxidoreductase subunit E